MNSLEFILEELDNWVFSDEQWNQSNFYKIPEITYSYNYSSKEENPKHILNETLFVELWGLKLEVFNDAVIDKKKRLIDEASKILIDNVNKKKKKILQSLEYINDLSSNDEVLSEKRDIIEGGLVEILDHLELMLTWLDFEKEKALVWNYFTAWEEQKKYCLSDEERKRKTEEVEKINKKIYWEKLSDIKKYREGILDYFYTKYENYKQAVNDNSIDNQRILTSDEVKRYEKYLDKFNELDKEYVPKKKESAESIIDKKWEKIDMKGDDIIDFFDFDYKANDAQTGWMKHKAEYDSSISTYTDTPTWLHIPVDEKRKVSHLKKVNRLSAHENTQHWVTLERHKKIIWNIRWKWNLELAEWAATLLEDMFEYGQNLFKEVEQDWKKYNILDIDKLDYVANFPKTLAEEVLTDEEFLDFLKLHEKVEPDNINPLARYLRHKRTWVQKKDVTYTLWKIKAAHYYNDIILWKSDGDFSDLFEWKVWFDQIEEFKIVKNSKLENNNKLNKEIWINKWKIKNILDNRKLTRLVNELSRKNIELEKEKTLLPENFMFHEAVYFSVIQREKRVLIKKKHWKNKWNNQFKIKNAELNTESFYTYLEIKYPGINFSKEKINSIRFWFKKQLLGAVLWVEKTISIYEKSKEQIEQIEKDKIE